MPRPRCRDRRKDPRATGPRRARNVEKVWKNNANPDGNAHRPSRSALQRRARGAEQCPSQVRSVETQSVRQASRSRRARGSCRQSPGHRPVAPRGCSNAVVGHCAGVASRRPRITRSRSTPSSSATAGRSPQRWKPAPMNKRDGRCVVAEDESQERLDLQGARLFDSVLQQVSRETPAVAPWVRCRRPLRRSTNTPADRRTNAATATPAARRRPFRTTPKAAGARDRTPGTRAPAGAQSPAPCPPLPSGLGSRRCRSRRLPADRMLARGESARCGGFATVLTCQCSKRKFHWTIGPPRLTFLVHGSCELH